MSAQIGQLFQAVAIGVHSDLRVASQKKPPNVIYSGARAVKPAGGKC